MDAPVSVKANAPAGRAEAFISSQAVPTLQHFDFSNEVPHERNESSVSAISDKRAHSGHRRPNEQNQEDAEFRSPFSIRGRRSELSRTLGATSRAQPDGSHSAAEAHDARRATPLARLGARTAVLTRPEPVMSPPSAPADRVGPKTRSRSAHTGNFGFPVPSQGKAINTFNSVRYRDFVEWKPLQRKHGRCRMNAKESTVAPRVQTDQRPVHRGRREHQRQIKGGDAAASKGSKKAASEIGSRGTLLTLNGPRRCGNTDEGLTAARRRVRANADINRSRPPGAPTTSRRHLRRKTQRRVASRSSCVPKSHRRTARMRTQIPAHRLIPWERCVGRWNWPEPAQQSEGSTS